jgi:hypothetical protein
MNIERITPERTRALAIIEAWIDRAHADNMLRHKVAFWVVRDLLEGRIRIPPADRDQVVSFLREQCKPSADRDLLLAELGALP